MGPKITAVVLAGGKGSRMQTETPKQYLPLLGKPVLYYSLAAFEQSEADEVILVTSQEEYCRKEIIEKYGLRKVAAVIPGGRERYHSVYQGLLAAKESGYVLIHDGARPLISVAMINSAIEKVKETGACVVGVPVKDTVQITEEGGRISATPERKRVWTAQTPQCFAYPVVLQAYERAIAAEDGTITDDAMVVTKYSNAKVYMLQGEYENIKITTPEDMPLAECLLNVLLKKSEI